MDICHILIITETTMKERVTLHTRRSIIITATQQHKESIQRNPSKLLK